MITLSRTAIATAVTVATLAICFIGICAELNSLVQPACARVVSAGVPLSR